MGEEKETRKVGKEVHKTRKEGRKGQWEEEKKVIEWEMKSNKTSL